MKPLLHPSAARRSAFTGEVAKLSIRAMVKADFSASLYVDKNGRRAGVQALHLKPPYIGCATAMRGIYLRPAPNLQYIQELLGHKSSRTTEIYTHVTKRALEQMRSPFDAL